LGRDGSGLAISCERFLTSRGKLLLFLCIAQDGKELFSDPVIDSEAELRSISEDIEQDTGLDAKEIYQQLAGYASAAREWASRQRDQTASAQGNFLAGMLNSAAFDRATYSRDWLVKSLLVKGQPAMIGGPKKSLKTSLAIDLAVSLGTGQRFLGRFEIPTPIRVAVLSGESGGATLQETACRIFRSKGKELRECDSLSGKARFP
jgi:hypothetical protein